jgi:hypothetical protein
LSRNSGGRSSCSEVVILVVVVVVTVVLVVVAAVVVLVVITSALKMYSRVENLRPVLGAFAIPSSYLHVSAPWCHLQAVK